MEILRKRNLRPSSRQESSRYKIDTKKVSKDDVLIIEIYHENNANELLFKYRVSGKDLSDKNQIHFSANEINDNIEIIWHTEIKIENIFTKNN